MLTHREEERRVRRGKDAANGATVIFWRLEGGVEDELLALRVLLLDLVAIFILRNVAAGAKMIGVEDFCRWPPNTFDGKWTTMVDESTLNLTVNHR